MGENLGGSSTHNFRDGIENPMCFLDVFTICSLGSRTFRPIMRKSAGQNLTAIVPLSRRPSSSSFLASAACVPFGAQVIAIPDGTLMFGSSFRPHVHAGLVGIRNVNAKTSNVCCGGTGCAIRNPESKKNK